MYESHSRVALESGYFQLKREISVLRKLRVKCKNIVELERVIVCKPCNLILMSLRFSGRPIMHMLETDFYNAWTAREQQGLIFNPMHFAHPATRSVFRENDAVACLRQLTDALLCLKQHNIVHKDIKPDNVLINFPLCEWRDIQSERPVADVVWEFNHNQPLELTLCDFNIAEERDSGRIFDAQGTVAFSPPEVFGRIDPSSGVDGFQRDIWSMGVLAYCLLTGESPVKEAESSLMTQIQIVRLKTDNIRPQLPAFVKKEPLRRLVESLLDPDPSTRITVDRCARELRFLG